MYKTIITIGILFLFIVPVLASPTLDDGTGLMESCWPMKGQNQRHTGLSPYSTEGNNGVVKWKYWVDGPIDSGAIIDNNNYIYFGVKNFYFYSLYPNGSLNWRFKVDDWIWSTPAIAEDGTIYIGTYGDSLYAINHNGSLKWRFVANGSITSSPAIGDDGCIYFGAAGPGRIYAINPNGTEKWYYDTGYWILSDPAIAVDGTIYIGSADSYFYAMNPDGTLKWRFKTGDIIKSHPAIGEDGTIYFDSFDGYFRALNPNGTLKWKINVDISGSAGVAIDEDGIIYGAGRYMNAIYPNGTIKWRFFFNLDQYSEQSSPAISSDGTIYIGVNRGNMAGGYLYAIDKESGGELWHRKVSNDWVDSSPCIGVDGTVYIGSASTDGTDSIGEFYAIGRNETNQPPNIQAINGNIFGISNTPQSYSFMFSDPDLDDIELLVDWGDDTDTGWIGSYDSGEEVTLDHTWSEKGTYQIRAKARDTYDGSESDWSSMSVIMPKNKIFDMPIINAMMERIIQRFPWIEYLLMDS